MNQVTSNEAPPSKTIAEIASEGASFTALAAGLKAAGLIDTLAGAGPFTMFAPSDEAFKKLPYGALDALMNDKAKLKVVLNYHLVTGHMPARGLKAGDVKTFEGSTLQVKVSAASVAVNTARVLADVVASNGIIHIIDSVLLPKNLQPLAAAA
jgi:uncharacterized surface protein with fasciclin (FAS1) repeats